MAQNQGVGNKEGKGRTRAVNEPPAICFWWVFNGVEGIRGLSN